MKRTLGELAKHVGGELHGDARLVIEGLAGLEDAREGQLSFFSNSRYKAAFLRTNASAVIVAPGVTRDGVALITVANPLLAYARIAQLFFPPVPVAHGIRKGALVDPEAKIDSTAAVLPGAIVEEKAVIGPRVVLHPGAYVGPRAQVGAGTVLHPNATVTADCIVGERCILHPGSVVGADGFGFAFDASVPEHAKIPQAGIARLEDDVELGANACVDRATLGETLIGRGTKIDNLVQVAHNVKIGPLSILCAQVGISGSAIIGTGVVLGGQVGVGNHLHVGDGVRAAGQTGIAQDAEAGRTLGGYPAMEIDDWKRSSIAVQRLPELLKELRALRKRVEALEKKKEKAP